MTTIETERLLLRQWTAADKAPYAALNADPAVMEHFPAGLDRAQSDAMVDRMTATLDERGWGLWAAEERAGGELIGFIGLSVPSFETAFTPCVEVGWRLAAHHWGHGYAPEGAAAVLAYAFATVDLPNDEVVSFTTDLNTKSRRVMEKIGLTRNPGRDFDHPNHPTWSGRHHVLYAIDRASWQARQ